MAAPSISFGSTIWDNASTGVGYKFTPGSSARELIQVPAPLGTGYWTKAGNKAIATHALELSWLVADPAALKATVDALADGTARTLSIPEWGTFLCVLEAVSSWDCFASPGGYIVTANLSLIEFP